MFKKVFLISMLFYFSMISVNVFATGFANPDSTLYGDDIDGTGYFSYNVASMLSLQLYDVAEVLTGGANGAKFGFYFQGDPGSQVTLFDSMDGTFDTAIVDFQNGYVLDFETSTVQSVFTVQAVNVGFYLAIDGLSTLYSDASLNSNFDVFGAFPVLGTPASFLNSWYFPNGSVGFDTLAWEIVTFNTVPEPGSMALFAAGLMSLSLLGRRKNKR